MNLEEFPIEIQEYIYKLNLTPLTNFKGFLNGNTFKFEYRSPDRRTISNAFGDCEKINNTWRVTNLYRGDYLYDL
jgi:hypothetical protein